MNNKVPEEERNGQLEQRAGVFWLFIFSTILTDQV